MNNFSTEYLRSYLGYDSLGRNIRQLDYKAVQGNTNNPGALNTNNAYFDREVTFTFDGQVRADSSYTLKSDGGLSQLHVVNNYGTNENQYLGSVLSSTTNSYSVNGEGNTNSQITTTTNQYKTYNGYIQSGITNSVNSNGNYDTYTTAFTLNSSGDTVSVHINDGRPRYVNFVSDHSGQIIRRSETDKTNDGDPLNVSYRFSGREMLSTTNNRYTEAMTYEEAISQRRLVSPEDDDGRGPFNSTIFASDSYDNTAYSDAAQAYDPLNSFQQGSGSGLYTVRAGDSLSSIAASLYGDSSLWYKIASVNGLSSQNASLVQGFTLNLPTGVVKTSHNADTFTPYNPGEAIGDVSPVTPNPNSGPKCGVFGQVLLAVVAVAVSVVTAGAALAAMVPGLSVGAAVSGVVGGSLATIAGASATGFAVATGIGAASAAVGSVVSQGLGVLTGIQEKFSWKGVAQAVLAGGLGGEKKADISNIKDAAKEFAVAAWSNAVRQGIATAMKRERLYDN